MKAACLVCLGLVLLLIVGGVALVITFLAAQDGAGSGVERTMLAALAGALGATLSGGLRLRDQLENLNELRAFAPAAAVQPLLGATASVVLLLVLDRGVVTGETSWPKLGLLAFTPARTRSTAMTSMAKSDASASERSWGLCSG